MKRKLTLWVYTYDFSDLDMDNRHGESYSVHCKDDFIGTIRDFELYKESTESLWGCSYSNVTKRHATQDEITRYYHLDDDDDIPF